MNEVIGYIIFRKRTVANSGLKNVGKVTSAGPTTLTFRRQDPVHLTGHEEIHEAWVLGRTTGTRRMSFASYTKPSFKGVFICDLSTTCRTFF